MKKIHTILKQLAERRARVIGELNAAIPLEQIADQIAILKSQLENMESLFLAATIKKERLKSELAAIDKQFLESYPTVNIESIAPIAAWKGKYGKRGSLKNFVYETLKSCSPAFIPTNELGKLAIVEFALVFENSAARRTWYDNSLRGALKKLLIDGLVEQSEEQLSAKHKSLTHWRLKQESRPSLASLRSEKHLSWRSSVDR